MKAYVIKNKEGKYFGYYDSENNRFEFSKKPKRFIMFNTLRDANKIKNLWKMNKCEVVEVTIAEADLEYENKQLKEQLTEKDKEIERLKYQLLYSQAQVSQEEIERFNNNMLAQRRPYEELEGKSLYEISQIYQNQVRKQICDEIRQAFNKEDFWLYGDNHKIISIHDDEFNNLLNKIEQGK